MKNQGYNGPDHLVSSWHNRYIVESQGWLLNKALHKYVTTHKCRTRQQQSSLPLFSYLCLYVCFFEFTAKLKELKDLTFGFQSTKI
ncbi:hypothetical protein RJT34_27635 [Clitoria ternatea]|uniref:Uncharacterized protein n=1 Tax=Clitoria ternatea TaxID=43366 RepID=A0AAN9IB33_CLITE